MTITKQDIIDSFREYHADSDLSYTDMTKLEEILQAILSINGAGGGGGGDASAANQLLQLTELEEINTKTPTLVGGKVPVDVASLSVTVDNASIEIANDIGNPVPISDANGSITIDGTITANAGTNLNTSLLALESGGNLASINTKLPTLTLSSTRLLVDGSGVTQPVSLPSVSSSSITSVNAVASDTTIIASNAARKGLSFYLDSTDSCYLLLGSGTSSSSNYSVKLTSNSYYELSPNYTGVIKGIFTGTNGSLKVTEFS